MSGKQVCVGCSHHPTIIRTASSTVPPNLYASWAGAVYEFLGMLGAPTHTGYNQIDCPSLGKKMSNKRVLTTEPLYAGILVSSNCLRRGSVSSSSL
jgi:hypothetical protein